MDLSDRHNLNTFKLQVHKFQFFSVKSRLNRREGGGYNVSGPMLIYYSDLN